MYSINAMNMIRIEDEIEFVAPDFCSLKVPAGDWELISSETILKFSLKFSW